MTIEIGSKIGNIRVVRQIGEGGMGLVYEGYDEALARRVALKAIRPGPQDSVLKVRFLREARILSQLDLPDISRIYDYVEGSDQDVLVLEFVDGRELGEAIGGLGFRDKLDIALQIVEVLVLAHRAGVVHRDLKPANVMIGPEGRVKVLDFGIARWIEGTVPENPRPEPAFETGNESVDITGRGGVLGTLSHMSPEQARGDASVGPPSDMFSFGLLLQEILTARPARPLDRPFAEWFGALEEGPHHVPEELDRSVHRLILDLTQPAAADRPTASATAQRLRWILTRGRRLRRRAAILAGVLAVLGIGAKYTYDLTEALGIAETERARAREAERIESRVSDLLLDLLTLSDPESSEHSPERSRELIERAIQESADLAPTADRRARLLERLGEVSRSLGEYDQAEKLLVESLELVRSVPDAVPVDVADAQTRLAELYWNIGRLDESYSLLQNAIEVFESELGSRDLRTIRARFLVTRNLSYRGRLAEAEALARRALSDLEKERGSHHPDLAEHLISLAIIVRDQGRLQDAAELLERSLEIMVGVLDADHPSITSALTYLASTRVRQGRLEAAERHYREAYRLVLSGLGPEHPDLARTAGGLADTLLFRSLFEIRDEGLLEVAALANQALRIRRSTLDEDHPALASCYWTHGALSLQRGRFPEAEAFFRQATDLLDRRFGDGHHRAAFVRNDLAVSLAFQGRFDAARVELTAARKALEVAYEDGHPDFAWNAFAKYRVERLAGRDAEALESWRRIDRTLKSAGLSSHAMLSYPDRPRERTRPR